MRPEQTEYYLATEDDEAALAFLPSGDEPRRFPTVVAKRDGKIIGYLGTLDMDELLVAGPLEVMVPSDHLRSIVALRLIQAYEMVLLHSPGVGHYYFTTDDPTWISATSRCPRTRLCCELEDGFQLFRRDLPRIIPGNATVN